MLVSLPQTIEQNCPIDLPSILLNSRQIYLFGDIDADTVHSIITQLQYLDSLGNAPIELFINSLGGSVYDGLALYDTMQFIKSPVHTICVGQAMSMAAIILAGGEAQERSALPNSTIMIHQAMSLIDGKHDDLVAEAKEVSRIETLVNQIMSKHTGNSMQKLIKDQKVNKYMSAEQALEYGIIDFIVTKR